MRPNKQTKRVECLLLLNIHKKKHEENWVINLFNEEKAKICNF